MALDDKDLQKIGEKIDERLDQGFGRFRHEIVEVIEQNINPQFDELRAGVSDLKSDVSELKSDVSELKSDVNNIKAQMVTKDYLDDKLADLRGDYVVLMRKEDKKLTKLVEILTRRELIDTADADEVLTLEPFRKV
ncbi:MAG TPA: hypothetical protein VMX18_00065 [Candidatus Bipolaricaulota bacterium]|nr:hypothetical protein [Candidatus Bipolaricaulota bacterium]